MRSRQWSRVDLLDRGPAADPLPYGRGGGVDQDFDGVGALRVVEAGPDEGGGVGGGQRRG